MASEQTNTQKKRSRNCIHKEPCQQILYRHKDCIPSSKLINQCEQQRLLTLKSSQEVCSNGVTESKEATKNIKVKNTKSFKKGSQDKSFDCQNGNSDKTNEDLSKSRKRRYRKQRLLTTLAPSNSPSLPAQSAQQTKSNNSTPCPGSIKSVAPVPVGNNNDNNVIRSPSKEIRKRFDKNIISRNKSVVKSKTLDSSNLTKADLIKSIEEKTLNSLLQTLAPLTNTSPKREKVLSTPIFSFKTPEKKLACCDTKNSKDGVFYFGESRDQLEKCSSDSSKNTIQPNKPGNSVDKLNKTLSYIKNISLSNDSVSNFKSVKNTGSSNLMSSTNTDTQKLLSYIPSDLSSKEILLHSSNLNNPQSNILLTNLSSNKSKTENTKLSQFPNNPSNMSNTSIKPPLTQLSPVINKKEAPMNVSVTMPSEIKKTDKTREEILLEREAKKAAKLAAKTKNKDAKIKPDREDTLPVKTVSFVAINKEDCRETSNNTNTQERIENTSLTSETSMSSKTCLQNTPTTRDKVVNLEVTNDLQDSKSINPATVKEKDETTKSKAELKAERRAKQEAQRAAKTQKSKLEQPQKENSQVKPISTSTIRTEQSKVNTKLKQLNKKQDTPKSTALPRPRLFSHLHQEKSPLSKASNHMQIEQLHPAIVLLGVQYATRVVVGSNARCIALLRALKEMIQDYTTPTDKEFSRGLEEDLGPVMRYLNQCRPSAVSMTNVVTYIKRSLIQLPNTISDIEAIRKMCDLADTYIYEQIDKAGESICQSVEQKIANGDIIVTYGCSSLVCRILVESHLKDKKFKVVVVDGHPWLEGREMLRRLVNKGLSCTYVLISAASFIMRQANKVLLGAHAFLANGYVMSRAGSSQLALLADCYNVPVLVCCETHKFSERVQTDAFVYNELCELSCDNVKGKDNVRVTAHLTPLSMVYDVTPPDLVSAVVTERGILPCTSVPVILRLKPSEFVM